MRKNKSWVCLVVAIVLSCVAVANVLAMDKWSYEGNVLPQNAMPAWTKTAASGLGEYAEIVGGNVLWYYAVGNYCHLNYTLSNPEYWHEVLGTYRCDFRTYSYAGPYQSHQDYRFNIGTNQFNFEIYSEAGYLGSTFPSGTIRLRNQADNTGWYGDDWHTYRFEYRVATQQACLSIVDDPENPVTIFTDLGPSAIVASSNYVQFGRIDDDYVPMYGGVDFLSFNQDALVMGKWSYEGNVLPQNATPSVWTKTAASGLGEYAEAVGGGVLWYYAVGNYCHLNYTLSYPEYWREVLGTYRCDFRTYSYAGPYQSHQDYRFNIGTNQFNFEICSEAGYLGSTFPPGTIRLLNQAVNTEGYGDDWHTYRFEYRVAAQQACLLIVDDPDNPVTIFTNLGPSAIVAASNYVQFGRIDDDYVPMYGGVDFLSFNQGTNVLASSMSLGGFADEFETGGSTGNNLYFLYDVAGSQSPALDVVLACDQTGDTISYRGGASFTLNKALPDGLYQLAMQVQPRNIKKDGYGVPPADRNGYFAYLIEATGNGIYNGVTNGNSGFVIVYPQYNDSAVGGANPPWKNFALAGWASPGFLYSAPSPVYLSGIDGVTSKLRVYVDDPVMLNYGFLTVESFDILDTSGTKDLSLMLFGGMGGSAGAPSAEILASNASIEDQLPANGTVFDLTYTPYYYHMGSMSGTNYVAGDFAAGIQAMQNAGLKNMTRNYARINISCITADWNNDDGWQIILDNVQLGANAALQCGAVGIIIDSELWGLLRYNTLSQAWQATTMFDETAALVRERGQQFMDAINAGFPNARIWFTYATSKALGATPKEPMSLRPPSLLPAFVDGLMDAGPNNEFIDGYEQSYYFTNGAQFAAAQSNILIAAAGLSADPARYQKRMKVGFGIFPRALNGGTLTDNEALNSLSLAQFADVLQAAYDYGDGFTWVYLAGDTPSWIQSAVPHAYVEVLRNFLVNHKRRPVRTVEIGNWAPPATPNEARKYYTKKMRISPCSGSATNWMYNGDYVMVAANNGNPCNGVGGAAFRPVTNETLPDGYYQIVADIYHANMKKNNYTIAGDPPADRDGSLSYRLSLAPGAAGTLSFAGASSALIDYYPTNADYCGNTPYYNGPIGLTDFVAYGSNAWTSGGVGYIRLQGGVNATNLIFEFYDNVILNYGVVGLKSFQLLPCAGP